MTAPLHVIDTLIKTVDPSCPIEGGCFSWSQAEAIYEVLVTAGLMQPMPTPDDRRVLDEAAAWERVITNQEGRSAFAAASVSLTEAARIRKDTLAIIGVRVVGR